jgi:hypothetical protein
MTRICPRYEGSVINSEYPTMLVWNTNSPAALFIAPKPTPSKTLPSNHNQNYERRLRSYRCLANALSLAAFKVQLSCSCIISCIDTLPAHTGGSWTVPTPVDHEVHGDWWQSQDLEECLHDANKFPRPKSPTGSLLWTAGARLVPLPGT